MNVPFHRSETFRWTTAAILAAGLPLLFTLLFLNLETEVQLSQAPFITLDYVTLPSQKSQPPRVARTPPPKAAQKPPEPETTPPPLPDEPVYAPAAPVKPSVPAEDIEKQPTPVEETGALMDVKNLDNTDFSPIYNPKPVYPAIAREAGIEGFVTVELTIDTRGFVKAFSIRKTVGHQAFALETAKVIRKWRFPPPRLQGRSLEIRYEYTVTFKLE